MDGQEGYTTGQLASAAGVGPQTLRYYERRGLLREPPRTAAGHRRYGSDDVRRVAFVRKAQALGFHLEEILGLLELRVVEGEPCHTVADAADRVVGRIDGKIASLQAMRVSLGRLRSACERSPATGFCPILDALDEDEG